MTKISFFRLFFFPIYFTIVYFVGHNNYFPVYVYSENDIEDVLDHTFCVESHSFGQHQQHELKPGGGDITVTEENKKEYVK